MIRPEYLLFFGLFFGGFTLSGTLSEAPVSHTEVAYIELLAQESETEEGAHEVLFKKKQNKTGPFPFFHCFSKGYLQLSFILHVNTLEKHSLQKFIGKNNHEKSPHFSRLAIPLYPKEDPSYARAA